MTYCAQRLRLDYFEGEGILHVSTTREIHISNEERLEDLFVTVESKLDELDRDRFYVVVDLSGLVIDTNLAQAYGARAQKMAKGYLEPNGFARYGYQITRVTVMLASESSPDFEKNLFSTREEAFEYIRTLIVATKPPDEPKDSTEDTEELDINASSKIDLLAPERY